MKHSKGVLFALGMLLPLVCADAQQVTIPYEMGFEEADSVELKNWVLNPGSESDLCADRWVVGSATCNGGSRSLYISCNGGASPDFGRQTNVQYAYRDFILPQGYYVVSFDWRCVGSPDAKLYAGIGSATSLPAMEANSTMGYLPSGLDSYIMDECKGMNQSGYWKNAVITGSGSKASYIAGNPNRTLRLFFAWVNTNKDTLAMPVGACIDNIQIVSANCPRPEHLTAEVLNCDSILATWEGISESYVFEYKKHGKSKWISRTGLTEKRYLIEDAEEGLYDLRVRGVCGTEESVEYSAYAYLNGFIVFCPENHCINYVNLNDSTGDVRCFYGTTGDPYAAEGVVDYGDGDKYSRHTVNWDTQKFDSRAGTVDGKRLSLIPDGEFASVRLGNWDVGSQAEGITYRYHVDAENAAILLLRYAIVMEDPSHEVSHQPRFNLEILDEYGNPLDSICGAADFAADRTRTSPGWHVNNNYAVAVCWKEWTTVGLNLSDYDGQNLTIRLTTYDCSQNGHYGYAYFTLGCANAKITSNSCGDESEVKINAPSGFTYQWYDSHGLEVPDSKGGRSLSLQLLPSDTATYTCVLRSMENSACSFQLSTSSKPRYPVAEFEVTSRPENCENRIYLTNKSHIFTRFNNVEEHHYDEPCEDFEWAVWKSGTQDTLRRDDRNPMVILPNEGGQYYIALTSFISDGKCHDDTTVLFTVPAIGDVHYDRDTTICEGEYAVFGDKYSDSIHYAFVERPYNVSWKSVSGCDSSYTWNLHLIAPSKDTLPDAYACAETPYCVNGDCYKDTADGWFVRFEKNQYGCYNTVFTYIHMSDSILPSVTMKDIEGDAENSGEFTIMGTGFTYYTINGVRHEAGDNHITGLNGGEFELVFYNDYDCSVSIRKSMRYPCNKLIFQRWGDVLSVLHPDLIHQAYPNLDTDFLSFQWLRDGVEIPGAVLSYYYEEGGLDTSAEYSVRVISPSGELVTCGYMPVPYVPLSAPAARKIISGQRLVIVVNDVQFNAQGERIY